MLSLSWILYGLFVKLVDGGKNYNSYATMYVVFSGAKFYLNFILVVGTCSMIDLFTSSISILFSDKISGTLMILVKEKDTLKDKLPKKIQNLLNLVEGVTNSKQEEEGEYLEIDVSSPGRKNNTNMIIVNNCKANETDFDKIYVVNERIELSVKTPKKMTNKMRKKKINKNDN